jgi:hypothetical protein
MELKPGDRVRIRGVVPSDCIGMAGTVLEVQPSAFFGQRAKRCRVDFNGRIRRILDLHLICIEKKPIASSASA